MGLFDRDKWQEIFATIMKNKLRSFLTALGVFWGIFMLVFLLGMGKGLENGVYKDFGSRAKNIMYVWATRTTLPFDGLPSGRRVQLNLSDIDYLKQKVDQIELIAPRNEVGPFNIEYKGEGASYSVRGELTDMPIIEAFRIHQGRYINDGDIKEARKVAVIGTTTKDVLFGEEDAIGKHITIKGIDFKVVGVFGPDQVKEWTRGDTEVAVVPLTTLSRAFGTGDRIDYMVVSVKPGTRVAEMEPKIRKYLKEINRVDPEDPQGIGGFNLEKEFQQIQGLFIGIKVFLWFVGIGTLLAGIIGVSNIMLIIVKERTKEIGIRKALGATPRSIISMILTESVFLTALSGYLGIVLGTFSIWGISALVGMAGDVDNFHNPEIDWYVGAVALFVLVLAGTIAGFIPALQAAKVNPVVALKDE